MCGVDTLDRLVSSKIFCHILGMSCVLKALEVNRELNCSTAVLMESLKQLEEVESHTEGLLYGIPVSIKDNVDYKVLGEVPNNIQSNLDIPVHP